MRVLIIDDEPNVRAGIKVIIPWKDYDFEIIGEGGDGVDGLNKILNLKPDLVLIDIRMPGLSGLEVVEEARKKGYKGKFILTTGYSDFEYAKKAIHLGVSNYILKPIDEDELIQAVSQISDQIQEENERSAQIVATHEYMQQGLLLHLILGKELTAYEEEYCQQLVKEKQGYYLAIVKVEEKEQSLESIFQILKDEMPEAHRCIAMTELNDQIILLLEQNYEIRKLEKLSSRIEEKYRLVIKIAVGNSIGQLQEIKSSYKWVKDLLENSFLFPELRVLTQKVERKKEEVDLNYGDVRWLSKQLCTLLQVNDKAKIKTMLEELKVFFRKQGASRQRIMSLCSNTLINTMQALVDTYSDLRMQVPQGEVVIERIYNSNDIDDMIDYIEEELVNVIKYINISTPESNMQKIVYYIENNYNTELKLEYLATLFNYNSAYLGKSFKNYTGTSFNVYLDQLRISKAKELLRQGEMKVYEIAQIVGYKHMDYFHSKFKKYVGVSPLEYKKEIMN